eukprot:55474-Pleurochrysis_carterae.AAC.4
MLLPQPHVAFRQLLDAVIVATLSAMLTAAPAFAGDNAAQLGSAKIEGGGASTLQARISSSTPPSLSIHVKHATTAYGLEQVDSLYGMEGGVNIGWPLCACTAASNAVVQQSLWDTHSRDWRSLV